MNSKNCINKTNLHFNAGKNSEDCWNAPEVSASNSSPVLFLEELFPETINLTGSEDAQTSHTHPHSDRFSAKI